MYFSVQGCAAERGFTPGQGIILIAIGSTTGSIFVIFYSEMSF